MCVHFEAVLDRERFRQAFGIDPPEAPGDAHLWPGSQGLFIRRPEGPASSTPSPADADARLPPLREAVSGQFGLVPHWAKDTRIARSTFNARSETAATKPSFRDAWRQSRRCIVPASAIWEPLWRGGKAVATRIGRADGRPMGMAGLWDAWRVRGGQALHSFTLLTVNADQHELMRQFHRPSREKRMVVILPEDAYDHWLSGSSEERRNLLVPFPADHMILLPEESPH